jgi:hypothetical protein
VNSIRKNKSHGVFLMDVLKKTIDLKAFIEREGPTTLRQTGMNVWLGLCPLHKDGDPSFWVRKWEEDVWTYHCFGCNSSGTIIDFCMERYGIINSYEAAVFAAEKEGIKCDASLIIRAAKEAKIKTDSQKTINLSHFVACENLRRLLRMCNGEEETMTWVAKSFSKMNKLLDDKNVNPEEFDKFREESYNRMHRMYKLSKEKVQNAN